MDMARVWPLVVQFGAGAVLCGIGVWCGIVSGYLDLKNRDDRGLVVTVVAGFVALLVVSALFTFWLPNLATGVER